MTEQPDAVSLVLFCVEGEILALPLDEVREVTRADRAPAAVPVADARAVLGLPGAPPARSRLLVLRHGDGAVGLQVDAVLEVRAVPTSEIVPPPLYLRAVSARGVRGVVRLDDRWVVVLSAESLHGLEASGVGGDASPRGGTG